MFTSFVQHSIAPCPALSISNTITFVDQSTYGVITVIDDADTRSYNNYRQRQIIYAPIITADFGKWKIEGKGTLTFNHNTYTESAIDKNNIFEYDSELTIRYKIGVFDFSVTPNLEGQSGYRTDYFNRHIFALDASAKASLLNKKLIITLSADDIFNKKQSYSTNETATTRVDYTSNRIHNYLRLSLMYSFDAK